MTTAMLFMALSLFYRGHKRRSMRKLADDTLAELEQELAREKTSKGDLIEANKRVEDRVKKLEAILRQQGMVAEEDEGD